jgi:hypothetical protein
MRQNAGAWLKKFRTVLPDAPADQDVILMDLPGFLKDDLFQTIYMFITMQGHFAQDPLQRVGKITSGRSRRIQITGFFEKFRLKCFRLSAE